MSLDVFCETGIDVSYGVIQDVILETGSECLICSQRLVANVLDDLASSSRIGHDMRLDFLIVGCWSHCIWLVFYISEVQEVDASHFQVIISFDQLKHPGE